MSNALVTESIEYLTRVLASQVTRWWRRKRGATELARALRELGVQAEQLERKLAELRKAGKLK